MSGRTRKKIVALLSGGLDSTVNVFDTIKHGHEVALALTFNYGQRAAIREIESSRKISEFLKIPHKVLDIDWFKDLNKSSLLVESEAVPTGASVEIENLESSLQTAKSVWVPNRNGVFLNIAAAYAEALGAASVVPGFNAEEAQTFPDNTREFMECTSKALKYSTSNGVTVGCYTVHLKKTDIVRLGQGLGVPWELVWPCYFGGEQWCGECESCLRSKRAFTSAGVDVESYYRVR